MLGGTYSTGTIFLNTNSVTVTGLDVVWNDVLEGDQLWPSNQGAMIIGADVVHPFNAIELLTPWPGVSLLGATYVIVKTSWKRHDVTELQKLWRTLAAELEATGNFVFVEGDEPDPEMGENGQWALKTNAAPWKLWHKEVNVWVPQGIPVGSIWRGVWEAATTYQQNDVVGRNGSSYISVTADNLNKPPESNPDDWDTTSSAGLTGADGGVVTIPYVFSNLTTLADPGDGKLRLNNTTQNAATILALDLIDSRGFDFTSVLASAFGTTNPVRGHIRIHKATDTTKFLTLAISSEASPAGFKQYDCTVIGSSGAVPFADLDPVVVNISRAGDKGEQGIQGIQGVQGVIGNPGGAIALPYIVDGLTTMDSDPGVGRARFNAVPQQSATVLRFNDITSLGAPVGNQFDAIATASTSNSKVGGRVFINGGTVPRLSFRVTGVEAKINYHNLTIQVLSASVPDPFPDGSAIVVDWTPTGDKGDAATIAVGSTVTGEPGTDAEVTNSGTSGSAVFNFTIPRGQQGQTFAPTYVVPDLAGRDAYDDDPVFNVDGSRMSVLVEVDSSNGGNPTLYFKQSNSPAVWTDGITFQAAGEANQVTFDDTVSGYPADNVQDAIDYAANQIRHIEEPVAMAMIFGRWV